MFHLSGAQVNLLMMKQQKCAADAHLYARDMHSNRRVRVGSMLRLPELSGPYRYVWHHVLFTVSKSYLSESPLLLLRGAESLWGDDTIKCPLWITWVRAKEPAVGPGPATRAGSQSESELPWSSLSPAEQSLPLPAMVRVEPIQSHLCTEL